MMDFGSQYHYERGFHFSLGKLSNPISIKLAEKDWKSVIELRIILRDYVYKGQKPFADLDYGNILEPMIVGKIFKLPLY